MSAKKSYNKRHLQACSTCASTFWTFKGRFCGACRSKAWGEGNTKRSERTNHNRQSPVNLLGATNYDYAAHVRADLDRLKEKIAPCIEQEEFRAMLKAPQGQALLSQIGR